MGEEKKKEGGRENGGDRRGEERTIEGDILPMSHNLDLMKIHQLIA